MCLFFKIIFNYLLVNTQVSMEISIFKRIFLKTDLNDKNDCKIFILCKKSVRFWENVHKSILKIRSLKISFIFYYVN